MRTTERGEEYHSLIRCCAIGPPGNDTRPGCLPNSLGGARMVGMAMGEEDCAQRPARGERRQFTFNGSSARSEAAIHESELSIIGLHKENV